MRKREKQTMKVIALNFEKRDKPEDNNTVIGCNLYSQDCGIIDQEDVAYLSPQSFKKIFGKTRGKSSRRNKRLAVIKIRYPKTGKSIYRRYVYSQKFHGVTNNIIVLNPASIRELGENSEVVGHNVEVSKGCTFKYYWYHPFHATRISMKLGIYSISLGLLSILISSIISIVK